jgi:AP-1 complex subunit beta-1
MSRYFSTAKKGEVHELKEDLLSNSEARKREAVKKIIANMTVGKDMTLLFTEVLNTIQTKSLELKKLVYLYIMNYAKSNPEKVLLAVNTFQTDARDPNPLIRALAIRTMGCIRVAEIAEHLCLPLQQTLGDEDPYVRKTAAICVAKLYDLAPDLVENQGFIEQLQELLGDANPMVVANAVAALAEIDELSSRSDVFKITQSNLAKLTAALNQCTEWGQVFILNSLAKYTPKSSNQAAEICERVVPRLNHANSAVVLGAVRVLLLYGDKLDSSKARAKYAAKMTPPLVTLLSKEPEIQYVALRNIAIIVQKCPAALANEMKVFFCKYNDPIYVKMEKLNVMLLLVNESTVEQVLLEFKEYASEVDVEFVRKSVRSIGALAIKVEAAAKRCIGVLLDLINTKVNYVVQEAIVVIRDVFRRYPNTYEGIIATLCDNLDTLDEPNAKAAMVWIIGEYAERIDNAADLLESFLDSFADEPAAVQLQLLTATVKLFLKQPRESQDLVKQVLDAATEASDNPDLRDRGFVYWRLLSSDPDAARRVVLAERPLIEASAGKFSNTLLEELVENIGTLASVYHKPPSSFVAKLRGKKKKRATHDDDDEDDDAESESEESDEESEEESDDADDLDDPSAPPLPSLHSAKGFVVDGAVVRRKGAVYFDIKITNRTNAPLSDFMLQINKNFVRYSSFPFPFPLIPLCVVCATVLTMTKNLHFFTCV